MSIGSLAVLSRQEPAAVRVLPPASDAFLGFFYAMQMTGGLGLLAVLVTVVRAKLYRCHTWFGFCVAWIISCTSYLLLVARTPGTEVPFGLCLSQAVLIYGSPALTAYATLALVIQLTSLFFAKNPKLRCDLPPGYWLPLLLFPYVIFGIVVTISLVMGLRNHTLVKRDEVYCVISNGIPSRITSSLVALAMVLVLGLVVFNGVRTWRLWRGLRRLDDTARLSCTLLFRLGIFTVFSVSAIGVSVAFAARTSQTAPNAFLALMPFCAFMIFGTQTDILHVWMFWRPASSSPKAVQHVPQDGSFDLDGDAPTLVSNSPISKSPQKSFGFETV